MTGLANICFLHELHYHYQWIKWIPGNTSLVSKTSKHTSNTVGFSRSAVCAQCSLNFELCHLIVHPLYVLNQVLFTRRKRSYVNVLYMHRWVCPLTSLLCWRVLNSLNVHVVVGTGLKHQNSYSEDKSLRSKIEKELRGIRGEKSSKDMASSRNLVSTIGALASPKIGDGTRCREG